MYTKPMIKWVGGKTQILDTILSKFPREMADYHEPFLGGGSVLFGLLSKIQAGEIQVHGRIYASDANETLIWMYKNIQTRHVELYACIQHVIREYTDSPENGPINRNPTTLEEAKQSRENYYYWTRKRYNGLTDTHSVESSAIFIFLNKTCFRGVFRIGPNGFNVPYGHNKNPEIVNWEHLEEVNRLVQGVEFAPLDFSEALTRVERGSFVYLDPPYAPENATSFVNYTATGFDLEQHTRLFNRLKRLESSWVMSNADVELVRNAFSVYSVEGIVCRRAIHSKSPDAKAREVIISKK